MEDLCPIRTSDFENKQKKAKMWLKVLRQNISHFARRTKGSASVEQKNGNGSAKNNKTNNNGVEVNRNEEQNGSGEIKGQAKKKSNTPGSGPLLQQAEISTSQLDFFKMLDEKLRMVRITMKVSTRPQELNECPIFYVNGN